MYQLIQNGVYARFSATDDTGAILIFIGFLALCIAVPYLLGSLNASIVISKLIYHDDIRNHGSGNAGATNMLRTYGWGAAFATLAGDTIKTVLSIVFAWFMMGGQWIHGGFGFSFSVGAYVAMFFCVVGHIYPAYFGMKGGKGVLCTAIAVGLLSPWVLLILTIIFVGTVAITKYVSLGSIVCAASYPIFLSALIRALFGGLPLPFELLIVSFAITALLIFAHRDNITRLRNHEENRFHFKSDHDYEKK